jgi:hypothetical protein
MTPEDFTPEPDEYDEGLVQKIDELAQLISQKPIASEDVQGGSAEYFLGQLLDALAEYGLLRPLREIVAVIPENWREEDLG